jgi:tetratricopeptide (TPR) repeat protein
LNCMSETLPPTPPGPHQQTPGVASPKRTRIRNRVKFPRPTREQRRLTETMLPLLQEAEQQIKQEQPARALAVLQAAAPEPPPYLPPYEQLRWHWLTGWALLSAHQFEEARTWLERGLALAGRLRPYVLIKQEQPFDMLTERVRNLLGRCYFHTGQPEQALLFHRQCLLAITSGTLTDTTVQMLIYTSLGNDALALGQPQAAISFFTLARQFAESTHADCQRGLAAWGLGKAYEAAQEYAQAQTAFEEALHIFEEQGNQHLSTQLHAALGQVLLLLKNYQHAEVHLQQNLEAAERSGMSALRAAARGAIATLYLAAGDFEQAISALQAGLNLLSERQDYRAQGQLTLWLAEAYQGRQDRPAAEQAFRAALALAGQSADNALRIQAHEGYAAFLSSQGRFQEAFAETEAARALQARRAAGH